MPNASSLLHDYVCVCVCVYDTFYANLISGTCMQIRYTYVPGETNEIITIITNLRARRRSSRGSCLRAIYLIELSLEKCGTCRLGNTIAVAKDVWRRRERRRMASSNERESG